VSGDQYQSAVAAAVAEQAAQRKPWWRSRTMWVNLLALALVVAEDKLQLLDGHLPGGVYAWLAFALPIVNLVLRAVTTAGVRL
jgi:hypothetical protein